MLSPAKGNLFMLLLLIFYVISSMAVYVGLELLVTFGVPAPSLSALSIVTDLVCIFLPCLVFLLLHTRRIPDILPGKRLSFINIVLIVIMVVVLEPLAMFLASGSAYFFGNEVNEFFMSMYDDPFYLVVLAMCVCPAIFEELAMRGIVLANYKNVSIKKAAIINGLFFGIFHLQPTQFLYAMVLGAALAAMVYYTRSFWAGVLAHFVYNFSQTVVSYTAYQAALAEGQTMQQILAEPPREEWLAGLLSLGVLAVIATFVFFLVFLGFVQYNKRKNVTEDLLTALSWPEQEPTEETLEISPPPQPKPAKVFNWAFWAVNAFYLLFVTAMAFLNRY